ncbi:MAG: peptidase U32 family protein [Candidatus Pacearchaeota archaeon]|jgi:putative protease
MNKKYELLAPVGNFPMLVSAINAGADAVYFGLKEFSMRANAGNFSINDLDKIEKFCKPKKIKRYLTLNTIIYDSELSKIESVIKKIKNKVDAVICWDLSVISLCKKYKIPFHISTQASVANSKSAEFYKKLGAERVVLARELSLEQIKKISKSIDVECFIHGAMCVAESGRCFTSQFLFGKSANRGQCLHPCRRSYLVKDLQEGYELKLENNKVMSAKDLCTLPFIDKLKNSGIKAFKIEGRNRDARYVDVVVRVYRKALDSKKPLTKEQISEFIEELKKVYNREFSSGFYLGTPTNDDFAKIEHSAATSKKHFVGKVLHYYPKISVATIKLVSDLKINDEVCIIGKEIGIINFKIASMQFKNKNILNAKKFQEIAIKVPSVVKKNDDVYLIVKI